MTRRWQRATNGTEKQLYKEARDSLATKIRVEVNKATNNNFAKSLGRLHQDPGPYRKQILETTKHFKSRPNNTLPLIKDGQRLVTNSEKCEKFASHFQSNHDSAASPSSARLRRLARNSKRDIGDALNHQHTTSVTTTDVKHALRRLKNAKAAGPDHIGNRLLKKLPEKGVNTLRNILNACIRICYFPKAWKIATVTAIHKLGKPANLSSSYRPISLLSNIGKLFERLIMPYLQSHLEDNNIIGDFLYGFRPMKSCTHQLFQVTKLIRQSISTKHSVGMLALDLKAAFDTLWYDGLLYKMTLLH